MQYRRLGESELEVSEISLGSWLTFGAGIDDKQSIECVRRALELGINFIDTANVYGRGEAEAFLGNILKEVPRASYVLATKAYFPMGPKDSGLSRAQIFKQLNASLERLQTDHVDLFQCHRYDGNTPLDETMRALSEVVEAGKARYVGFSEWPIDKIRAAREMTGVVRFVSSQPQYSMLRRGAEDAVIPYCVTTGVSQIVWSPLAQGVLTGKYAGGTPADSRAASRRMGSFFPKDYLKPTATQAINGLSKIAADTGLTMAQLALAWVLRLPNVASAIVGATRAEQIVENAAAAGRTLSDETLGAIDTALAPVIGVHPKRHKLGALIRQALARD